jgi:hypothetical protein
LEQVTVAVSCALAGAPLQVLAGFDAYLVVGMAHVEAQCDATGDNVAGARLDGQLADGRQEIFKIWVIDYDRPAK